MGGGWYSWSALPAIAECTTVKLHLVNASKVSVHSSVSLALVCQCVCVCVVCAVQVRTLEMPPQECTHL